MTEQDDKTFCTQKVQELVQNLRYLGLSNNFYFFPSDFFQHFMLDMIFVNNLELWKYISLETVIIQYILFYLFMFSFLFIDLPSLIMKTPIIT